MAIEFNNRQYLQDDDEADINGIPSPGTPNSMGSDDDDDGSDTSSILTELGADDFPGHFREHGGRLFHSHGNLPYPLPVDGNEQMVCRHFFCLSLVLIEFFSEAQRATQDFARPLGFSLRRSRHRSVSLRAGQAETRPRPLHGDRSMVSDFI